MAIVDTVLEYKRYKETRGVVETWAVVGAVEAAEDGTLCLHCHCFCCSHVRCCKRDHQQNPRARCYKRDHQQNQCPFAPKIQSSCLFFVEPKIKTGNRICLPDVWMSPVRCTRVALTLTCRFDTSSVASPRTHDVARPGMGLSVPDQGPE